MRSPTRRQALALFLIATAGVASVVLRAEARAAPSLPPLAALIAGSDWQPQGDLYQGSGAAVFRQWLLRDSSGNQAVLYVGVTGRVQTMARWSGELGYEGEGYSVRDRGQRMLQTGHGRTATVTTAVLQRLSTLRLVEYAVVDPDGIRPQSTDSLASTAWDVIRGQAGPYYLVRASVAAGGPNSADAARVADRLLVTVLPHVLAESTAGPRRDT